MLRGSVFLSDSLDGFDVMFDPSSFVEVLSKRNISFVLAKCDPLGCMIKVIQVVMLVELISCRTYDKGPRSKTKPLVPLTYEIVFHF